MQFTIRFGIIGCLRTVTAQSARCNLYRRFTTSPMMASSSAGVEATEFVYESFGDPLKVLKLRRTRLPTLARGDVLVRMLASPINPADINMIQGVYAIKPTLPAIGGNEGVGVVTALGGDSSLSVGDWVIPSAAGKGLWRTFAVFAERELIPLKKAADKSASEKLSLLAAATIVVNPATAYRMLADFVDLKSGETVVQNGANSAVGQMVIQIARHRGLRTVNVVRDRPTSELDEMRKFLRNLGADAVVTENELKDAVRRRGSTGSTGGDESSTSVAAASALLSEGGGARLAFNCVGGKSVLYLSGALAPRGVLVTYGGMSKQPLSVPTGALIFNDIHLRGFWMTRWYNERLGTTGGEQERSRMTDELVKLFERGVLSCPPVDEVDFNDERALRDVLERATADGGGGAQRRKHLIVFK